MAADRLRIRRAEARDAEPLARFATDAFRDAYRGLDDPADIESYVAEHFQPQVMATVIATAGATTLLAEAGSHFAGYAILRRESPPDCVATPDPIQLWRLYLGKAFIGQGLGAEFMLAVHAEARRQGARTLWLGVYDRNVRAVAFYERFGMRQVGTREFLFAGKSYVDPIYAGPVLDGELLSGETVLDVLDMPPDAFTRIAFDRLSASRKNCPRDGKRMRSIYREAVELDICPACHSLWVDRGERERIAGHRTALHSPDDRLRVVEAVAGAGDGVTLLVLARDAVRLAFEAVS